ncbi:MAG: endolytic transglycosylase MltG [Pseudomonadota bacterium]
MSRRSFRIALLIVLATVLVVTAAGAIAYLEISRYPHGRAHGKGREVVVEIGRGMSFPEVVAVLSQANLIGRPAWFRLYAIHRGMASKVRAGRYVLRDDLSPAEVLDALVKGAKEEEIRITVPEGKHIIEVAASLAEAGLAPARELEELCRDVEWLREQGIDGTTADGYLFPDTYLFRLRSSARTILSAMIRRHRVVYDELGRAHSKSLGRLQKKLGWGDREIVIMASIVEKETGVPEERRLVASVFYNRLILPSFGSRLLETDPTIRYGCTVPLAKSPACQRWDPAGRLFRAQLDDKANPYNTYRHAKLPPGPIANPGRAALEAAMDPASTEYLYFVAKDERSHVFSETYAEHQRWVDKYQR